MSTCTAHHRDDDQPLSRGLCKKRKIYEYVTGRWGFLPNYFQALGHNVQLLQDQVNLFTNAMNEERGLPKIIKEQIATVVSGINMSSYASQRIWRSWAAWAWTKISQPQAIDRLQVGAARSKGHGAVEVLREAY
jgi:hypothetical protein